MILCLRWVREVAIRAGVMLFCSGGDVGNDGYVLGGDGPHMRGARARRTMDRTSCGEVEPPNLHAWRAAVANNASHGADSWDSFDLSPLAIAQHDIVQRRW